MKNFSVLLIFGLLATSQTLLAQKQLKTYDVEKFVKKLKPFLRPNYIGYYMPDQAAQKYLMEKGGYSKEKIEKGTKENFAQLQEDVKTLWESKVEFEVKKINVKTIEESPVKIANIVLDCKAKKGSFTMTLKHCIQTDASWYLGDEILIEGEGYDNAIEAAKNKKPGKLAGLMAAAQQADEMAKKNEQEIKINELQSEANFGKAFPGWYITNAGEKKEGLITFAAMNDMSDDEIPLHFSLYTDVEPESISKKDIKAYFANSRLYTPVQIDGKRTWMVNFTQGAIHKMGLPEFTPAGEIWIVDTVADPTNTKLGYRLDGHYEPTPARWSLLHVTYKLNERAYYDGREGLADLLADYEDLSTKIRNKEKGYKRNLANVTYFEDLMFEKYNKWYDDQNPGTITYYELKANYKPRTKPKEMSNYQKSVIAAYDSMHLAPEVDFFEGRPSEAGADVASAKPEVKVKKESFIERLERIKADGNKVGVLVRSTNLKTNPKPFAEGITAATIKGRYEPLQSLDVLAQATANQLAEGFGVDVFEAVDYSKIPVKEGKYNKMDDWWATKYKIIVLYDLTPFYNAYYQKNAETGEKEFRAYMAVDSEVIIMAAEQDKPEKLKYVTASPKSWGNYQSESFVGPAETDFNIIQEVKKAINPPSDEKIIQEMIKSQEEKVNKLIKKKSK